MKSFFEVSLAEVTRLILVRHGRTASNAQGRMLGHTDVPLDDVGIKQAALMAKKVAGYEPAVVYSSPLMRARQTAAALAEPLGLTVLVNEDLIEYDFGELSDLNISELEEKKPELFTQINAWISMGPMPTMTRPAIAGAENIGHLTERICQFAGMVTKAHPGSVVVAVSHGALIRSMLSLWAGASLENRVAFRSDNASISVVDFYNGVPSIRMFNDICHLDTQLGYGRPVVL